MALSRRFRWHGGVMARPSADSLWSDRFERDSCGFGLIAHLHGAASHKIVATAVQALERLTHRGAVAADGLTGDGCGLLMSMPETYLEKVAVEAGIQASPGFAAGVVFLNPGAEGAARARQTLEQALELEGVRTLGWRQVPVDDSVCGEQAVRSLRFLHEATLKGLLRRVVGKIFPRTLIEGYCSEFEARNAPGGAVGAQPAG